MESNAFSPLTAVQLPSSSRLLSSACCPDKDLLLLVARIAGRDRMSLWKVSGSKTWEIDVGANSERIVGFDWSPDGQSIAVAHDPPAITIHSVQDGHEERALSVNQPVGEPSKFTGVWWRSQEKPVQTPTPDIFRRNNIIVYRECTLHSQNSSFARRPAGRFSSIKLNVLSATDLFAFQGSQTQTASSRSSTIPDVIRSWPTLQSDTTAASINTSTSARTANDGVIDEVDDTNVNSLLVAAGSDGHIHFFLDGAYPIGSVVLAENTSITTLFKDPKRPVVYLHPEVTVSDTKLTDLRPTVVRFPLLEQRKARDFAKLSTTAKELAWYITRVVNEMRSAWMGSETSSGARDLSPKWLRALATKQQQQFGQENPQPILDLTTLLVTGRASESLADFLGSGEQMSERGIQKWESTVTETLVKLRDYSEKRFSPACQRLYIVLEEIPSEIVDQCLVLLKRGIILSNWLASVARRELNRFKEFISWLRFEIAAANPSNETPPPIQHDILEVNQYIMSGLESSIIDKWFSGAGPSFSLQELGIPAHDLSLPTVLHDAREALSCPEELAWRVNVDPSEVADVDRNLQILVDDMIEKCRLVFDRSTGAVTRAATISYGSGSIIGKETLSRATLPRKLCHRERVVVASNQGKDDVLQYLAVNAPSTSEDRSFLCLLRHRYDESPVFQTEVALLECCLIQEDGSSSQLELLAFDFFDDECVVIVYRYPPTDGETFIATVHYNDLGYQALQWENDVRLVREEVTEWALHRLEGGQLTSTAIPIKRYRCLDGFRTGGVELAVNGRLGRRIACALDSKGTTLEAFDMEDDESTGEMDTDEDGD
ncbi:hypothetical protein AAF712_000909 [Marasmius tenuissimus]|uniref:Anaphase-promoting complex subunit 4 n=1 Tax=Marasmius tenuissimus TaxID=585030 RepID=A0ABR3AF20_9AGAR